MHAHRAQSIGQGRRADQIKGGIDAVRVQFAHGGRDLAGVEQGMVDAVLLSKARRSARRVVDSTVAPRHLASAAAARPTEEVPPRISTD